MRAIGGGGVPIEVLLVEDSPGDVRLTKEALRDASCPVPPQRFAELLRTGIPAPVPVAAMLQ